MAAIIYFRSDLAPVKLEYIVGRQIFTGAVQCTLKIDRIYELYSMSGENFIPNRRSRQGTSLKEGSSIMIGESSSSVRWWCNVNGLVLTLLNVTSQFFKLVHH